FQYDEGRRNLAPLLVRGRHHGTFQYSGMRRNGSLHLDGRDVLTATDDDVLLSVDDLDVVFLVPDGDIARPQPSAGEHRRGGCRVLVVAIHHEVAADDDLADGMHVPRHVDTVKIDHAHLAAREGPAG